MTEVRLSSFNTGNFNKGAGFIKQTLWYFVNALFVRASWNPFMGIKVFFLKLFGAKIGKGLVIKNNVNIKFPWKLTLGNDVWLGENAWIDNLDEVIIGNNVCISQGALLLTGNHDYTLSTFNYRNAPIIIEDGAWNRVWISEDSVKMESASCPDGLCVHQGAISDGLLPIVCLPNKVQIQIVEDNHEESSETEEFDAKVG